MCVNSAELALLNYHAICGRLDAFNGRHCKTQGQHLPTLMPPLKLNSTINIA